MELYKECMDHTGRKYPDGYGFAIIYCQNAGHATNVLYSAACNLVAYSFSKTGRYKGLHKDSDLARFVSAIAESKDYRDWLIEGCQLVLNGAYYGYPKKIKDECSIALGIAGHTGYSRINLTP